MDDIIHHNALCAKCGCSQTLPVEIQECTCPCHPDGQGSREYRAGYRGPFSEDVMAHQREMNRIQSGVNEISPTLDRIHAADTELLDWLQEQIVDTIYLDDGRIIDVCGGNLRVAIAVAKAKNPSQETS